MSVVVWDGKTLAADKLASDCDMATPTTKIIKTSEGHILAWVGSESAGRALADWFKFGAADADWPKCQDGSDEGARLIIITPNGKCVEYPNSKVPVMCPIDTPFMAWGSGRDYAMGALFMGATAVQAVEAASTYCITCGGGIDSYTIAEIKKEE